MFTSKTTKADLTKQIVLLDKKVTTLKTEVLSKSAKSAMRAALQYLSENIEEVVSVDMDTGYGHVTFKLKR